MNLLSNLPIDQVGVINEVHTDEVVKERLHSFGLIKGVEITPIKNSPLGCPRIYRCLNTTIAIRNKTAKQIQIYEKNITVCLVENLNTGETSLLDALTDMNLRGTYRLDKEQKIL